MVRNILELFETLAYLYCFAATYGKKMKYNIYVVIFVVAQLFLMTGMNDYGFPKYLISLSYALMFTYCILNYKSSIVQAVINVVLSVLIMGIIQVLVYSILVTVFGTNNGTTGIALELGVMILNFIIIYLVAPKVRLNLLSNYLLNKKVLSGLIISFVIIVLGSKIWKIKTDTSLPGEDFIYIVYFFSMLVLLLIEWQKTKIAEEKQRVQLEMNKLYYAAYEDLILSIRKRQHDFKNHLNAIQGVLYTSHSYEELRSQQENYMAEMLKDNEKTSILTMVENPLIAGFLSVKIHEAEKRKIEVEYDCSLSKQKISIPEYQLIEMLGILMDNAIEEAEQVSGKKKIWIYLLTDDQKLYFKVENTCTQTNKDNISKFFSLNYSNKGANRGLGLYKLKEMVKKYAGEIYASEKVKENSEVIEFVLNIPL